MMLCLLTLMSIEVNGAKITLSGTPSDVSQIALQPGQQTDVYIFLNDVSGYSGFITNLQLPIGVSIVGVENAELTKDVSGSDTHICSYMQRGDSDDSWIISVLSSEAKAFNGTNGAAVKIILATDITFLGGNAKLRNTVMCSANMASSNKSKKVKATTTSPTVNLSASKTTQTNVTLTADTENTVYVWLTGVASFCGFQANLFLPEGVTIKKSNKATLTRNDDYVRYSDLRSSDEGWQLLAMNYVNYTFVNFNSDNGAVMELTLSVDENFAGGNAQFKNIIFTDPRTTIDDSENIWLSSLTKATGISLNTSTLSIVVDSTSTLTATVFPETATDKSVTWTSSNEFVATVSSEGVVTAIAVGTATITATTNDGTDFSASCEVTVTEGGKTEDTDISKYDNVIYAKNQSLFSNSQVNLPIYMKNNVDMTAFSFDLTLPAGMTVAKNTKGKNIITLAEDRKSDHTISSNTLENGTVSVACLSLASEAFSGNDGIIAYVTVNVAESMEDGEYNVVLKNVRMATPSNVEYKVAKVVSTLTVESYIPGDVNNDRELTIVDAVGIVNFIIKGNTDGLNQKAADANQDGETSIVDAVYVVNKVIKADVSAKSEWEENNNNLVSLSIKDKNIEMAETFEMPVVLNSNALDFTAMQCNIQLPEGVTLEGVEADESHTVMFNTMEDGTIRLACLSLDNTAFAGNGSTMLTLKLRRATGFTIGTMTIDGAELATSSLTTTRLAAVKSTISSNGATGIESLSTASANTSARYNLAGQRVNNSFKGIIVENGKKNIIRIK